MTDCTSFYIEAVPDRIGTQIMWDIDALSFQLRTGSKYLGTVGNRSETLYKTHAHMCKFLNLPMPIKEVKLSENQKIFKVMETRRTPRVYTDPEMFTEDVREYTRSLSDLIHKNKKHETHIHIRRGDVVKNWGMRYELNEYYRKLIDIVKQCVPQTICVIHSQSHTDAPLLPVFSDCTIKYDKTAEEDFKDMINADILIMSKSSYSYAPAILNPNVVIYKPFWHLPLENWLDSTSDDFEENLVSKIQQNSLHPL
jgi:hypothetical protein